MLRIYTDGTWAATYDEYGSLVRFGPYMGDCKGARIIAGETGRTVIYRVRTPRLRRVIRDEPGIKITAPL